MLSFQARDFTCLFLIQISHKALIQNKFSFGLTSAFVFTIRNFIFLRKNFLRRVSKSFVILLRTSDFFTGLSQEFRFVIVPLKIK